MRAFSITGQFATKLQTKLDDDRLSSLVFLKAFYKNDAWGCRDAIALPNFARLVNPNTTKGSKLCPLNNTGITGFSDLPTAL